MTYKNPLCHHQWAILQKPMVSETKRFFLLLLLEGRTFLGTSDSLNFIVDVALKEAYLKRLMR